MRSIIRLPEPDILIKKKTEWLTNFLNSNKLRPDSSKYAHSAIRSDLYSMSFHKCFYCETKLKGKVKEIDHHIEVSVDRNLAYTWENLYLSCDNCNSKIPHNVIGVNETLNPCIDDDSTIQQHLTFKKELIDSNNNSDVGLKTIQKYRLETELLDARRLKQICVFQDVLIEIQKKQIEENRQQLTSSEKNIIQSFKRFDNPYSLMFIVLLKKHGL